MNATTEWSNSIPTKCGTYLIQYTGTWFPEGDPNNIKHELVDIVLQDLRPTLLVSGRFMPFRETRGWKWAKIITAK